MRLGLLADVHGNLPALEAVLALLDREAVDAYVCAGDLVGYGAFPNECVATVTALGATVVAGNHELMAIGRLPSEGMIPVVRESTAWTARALDEPTAATLAGLPPSAEGPGGVVVTHGSFDSPEAYVRDAIAARAVLARCAELYSEARVVVLGHTHEAFAWSGGRGELLRGRAGTVTLEAAERALVNPGAVGQSRDDRVLARAAVLDLGDATVRFHEVEYDVDGYRRALRERGLPYSAYHAPPRGGSRATRVARRVVRRARERLAR
jgi:predicted phosphodiesterase